MLRAVLGTSDGAGASKQKAARVMRCCFLWILGMGAGNWGIAEPLRRHVPSPDWRDQVIYFVVLDRFADGDSSNIRPTRPGVFTPGLRPAA
jgi:hypothetical protein